MSCGENEWYPHAVRRVKFVGKQQCMWLCIQINIYYSWDSVEIQRRNTERVMQLVCWKAIEVTSIHSNVTPLTYVMIFISFIICPLLSSTTNGQIVFIVAYFCWLYVRKYLL